ncbi:MAG: hypothetical protein AAF512_14540, partial [Pseudomonadota bacterium]
MRNKLNFIIALLCLHMSLAHADMILNKAIVDFEPNQPLSQDIEVRNTGSDTIYVAVNTAEIINPEQESPIRQELTDPRQAGILATPNRLIIPPGGRKLV